MQCSLCWRTEAIHFCQALPPALSGLDLSSQEMQLHSPSTASNCDVTTMFVPRRILQSQLRNFVANSRTPSRLQLQPSRNASTITYQSPPKQRWLWPRRLIYAGIFGLLGGLAGEWVNWKIGPPPAPGTDEDAVELDVIRYLYETDLQVVKEQRNNPDCVESEVYENYSGEEKAHRLTSGPLSGSRGFGLQVGPSFVLSKNLLLSWLAGWESWDY